jgi:hypothetical protein
MYYYDPLLIENFSFLLFIFLYIYRLSHYIKSKRIFCEKRKPKTMSSLYQSGYILIKGYDSH